MSATISALFWGILTFSLLVVLHEGGHFLAARTFGVRVHEFMIGLPGPALRFRRKETTYGITAVPLGGYVRIAGMEPGTENPLLAPVLAYITRQRQATIGEVAEVLGASEDDAVQACTILEDWGAIVPVPNAADTYASIHAPEEAADQDRLLASARKHTFRALSTWKRVVVLSSGVVVNLLSAFLVFVLVLTLYGVATPTLTVETVIANGPAATAHIQPGDTITALDGQSLKDWQDLLTQLGNREPGETVAVTVSRGDTDRTVDVVLGEGENGQPIIGVAAKVVNVKSSLGSAFKESFSWIGQVFVAIAGFFSPNTFQQSLSQSSGVVGIAVLVSQAAERGPIDYAFMVALLSLSLGAMNILPLPPLDGGKIAIEIVQGVTRRTVPARVVVGLSMAGTLLLFGLIGYLMYADILRYVVGG
ncbi:MAG: RIP metalloprotease [Coriobacteriia bacterium]